MVEIWSGQEAGEPSVSEDTLPFSADSGMGCESDTEPVTSPSEPVTPDGWSHPFPDGPEPVSEDGLGSLMASEVSLTLGGPVDAMEEYGQWLTACIQTLEREGAEEELLQVDAAVDALSRWEMFTGQLPVTKQHVPCGKDNVGLRRQVLFPEAPAELTKICQGQFFPLPLGGRELTWQDGPANAEKSAPGIIFFFL